MQETNHCVQQYQRYIIMRQLVSHCKIEHNSQEKKNLLLCHPFF